MRLYGLIMLVIGIVSSANAQGSYSGSTKKLIGMEYKDSNGIALLKGCGYHEASLITDINDPEAITVDLFQKGADAVVLFRIKPMKNLPFSMCWNLDWTPRPKPVLTAFMRVATTDAFSRVYHNRINWCITIVTQRTLTQSLGCIQLTRYQ